MRWTGSIDIDRLAINGQHSIADEHELLHGEDLRLRRVHVERATR